MVEGGNTVPDFGKGGDQDERTAESSRGSTTGTSLMTSRRFRGQGANSLGFAEASGDRLALECRTDVARRRSAETSS